MKNISKTINTKKSGTTSHSQSRINPLLLFNISMYTLAAICFMIYTTELSYAHAEGEEDLGSASSSLDASVTVGTACNFSGNVDIPHTSTIMNGVNSTDIGKTTMNVTCNDQGGYAVYAIGYTNDEYGNTALQSSISDDYNISTGTSTSGNTSNWSMKLATVSGTTTATIENGYSNYNTVPDDYTKVATLNTITNPGTSTTGSSISTTYQTYISPTQPASTYTGKVKYALVHPSAAPRPEKPKTINDLIYMQEFGTISEEDLASVKASMPIEATYTLKDQRDDQDYTIAKLKDGKIWMTSNLKLSGGSIIDSELSDVPSGYTLPIENGFQSDNRLPASSSSSFGRDDYMAYMYNAGNDGGNSYSWVTATAGSGLNNTTNNTDALYSICPAGWKLPNSRDTVAGNSDFYQLAVSYGMDPSDIKQNTPNFYEQAGPNTIPNFISTNECSVDEWTGIGRCFSPSSSYYNATHWSSTPKNSNQAYTLALNSSSISTSSPAAFRYGKAVRCLVK